MDTIAIMKKLREIELLLDAEEHPHLLKLIREAREYAIGVQNESPEQERRDSRFGSQ